jgi:hypothetical protein
MPPVCARRVPRARAAQPSAKRPTVTRHLPSQNAEIFTLTYGSIVRQLIADFEDLDEVNKQLEQM